MADATRSESGRRPRPAREKLSLGETWRRLNLEQRVAAVGALLLIISTLGPFSFVEAAIVLIGASVLLLLRRRRPGVRQQEGAPHLRADVAGALLLEPLRQEARHVERAKVEARR